MRIQNPAHTATTGARAHTLNTCSAFRYLVAGVALMVVAVVQFVLAVDRTGLSGGTYAFHIVAAGIGLALVIHGAIKFGKA